MDCKLDMNRIIRIDFFIWKNIHFRWHQIMLQFGSKSIIFRFDQQFDEDEIELPLSLTRISGEFNISNVVLLSASDRQENQRDLFFKVTIKLIEIISLDK